MLCLGYGGSALVLGLSLGLVGICTQIFIFSIQKNEFEYKKLIHIFAVFIFTLKMNKVEFLQKYSKFVLNF